MTTALERAEALHVENLEFSQKNAAYIWEIIGDEPSDDTLLDEIAAIDLAIADRILVEADAWEEAEEQSKAFVCRMKAQSHRHRARRHLYPDEY